MHRVDCYFNEISIVFKLSNFLNVLVAENSNMAYIRYYITTGNRLNLAEFNSILRTYVLKHQPKDV